MGRFDGVLLVSDFDNTLVYTLEALRAGRPAPPLPPENRTALERFVREGGRFAVATGRALATFSQHAETLPVNAPCVICNGAALYDFQTGRYLETILLDEAALALGQSALDRFPGLAGEAYHLGNTIYTVQPNELTRRHARLTAVDVAEFPSLTEVPPPVGKLLFEGEHPELERAAAFLAERSRDYELIFSAPHLLEMTARGATKGGMVRRLAARLGISMEHVYCVGDEANDVSMLTAAKQGFAPANCAQAARDCGATLVCHATEGALAEVIDILDRRY